MWWLKWAKYANGWRMDERYIEEVVRLSSLEASWRASRLHDWLSKPSSVEEPESYEGYAEA